MNTKTVIAALLITLGIVVLAYSGLSFTTPGNRSMRSEKFCSRPTWRNMKC